MRSPLAPTFVVAGVIALSACGTASSAGVEVPAGIDHSDWDRLLKTYVDDRGLVAYARWKANPQDMRALRQYAERLAAPASRPAHGAEHAATLLNAYNALTIAWVLENYPTSSIRATPSPFKARRHTVGGRPASLDDLEHATLRKVLDYRVHAALVCAARSCPPLSRGSYRADRLEQQLEESMARWLAREDLNRFHPGRAEVSSIFKWFREDFDAAGGVLVVLRRHAPESARPLLDGRVEVRHLDYDWSLNDQAAAQ